MKHGVWKPVPWFYVMQRTTKPHGHLFSLTLPRGWKLEGATWWWWWTPKRTSHGVALGPFWIGRAA